MKRFQEIISLILATGFGLGYLPLMPGTWASAATAVVCWWLVEFPLGWFVALASTVFFIGIIVVSPADRYFSAATKKESDNRQIVIDELLGTMVALLPFFYFQKTWLGVLAGFLLFRLFDVAKFGLAKLFDRRHNRWGVMLDDVFAGVHAGLILSVILWLV